MPSDIFPIRFCVVGQPVTQGSKRVVPIYKQGSPLVANGRVVTRVVDDNPRLGEWRQEIALAARQAYDGELLLGPLRLELDFVRPRPQSHFGSGKNARRLKESAPEWPTGKPDTVKLARAVEDALTGVVWRDDSQIVEHILRKSFGQYFVVDVLIRLPVSPLVLNSGGAGYQLWLDSSSENGQTTD